MIRYDLESSIECRSCFMDASQNGEYVEFAVVVISAKKLVEKLSAMAEATTELEAKLAYYKAVALIKKVLPT